MEEELVIMSRSTVPLNHTTPLRVPITDQLPRTTLLPQDPRSFEMLWRGGILALRIPDITLSKRLASRRIFKEQELVIDGRR